MEKNWNAMEKLWKSYGISFLGICTNPVDVPLEKEELAQMAENLELCTERNR